MENPFKTDKTNFKELLMTKDNQKNPTVIKKTIYTISNTVFVLDITPIIQACASEGLNSLITVDSIQGVISETSPVLFESISFFGDGCSGNQSFITPDHKSITVFFPSFFTAAQGNIPNVSCSNCEMCIRINPNGLKKNEKLTINFSINGQAILDNESCANVFEDCKRILTLKGPYSNNYVVNFTIEGKLTDCDCDCS
ncbi:hypothetical protein DIC82_14440 [Clostridium beijerinckii]|nr:hypothetical protein DIC82_14440 [Clostridium beijerinckii]